MLFLRPAMLLGTAGESLILYFVAVAADVFNPSVFLTPSPYGHSPYILYCKTPRNAAGHGKGRGLKSGLFPYAVL